MRFVTHAHLSMLIAGALLSGCALWRPTPVPLRTIVEAAHCATPVDTLIVMLPGSYSEPEDFRREGFVARVRARALAADLVLLDAHVGYYWNRSVVTRLVDDVIRPARARGYRQVWLAGISIGAVGAMLVAEAHPDEVDGVVLIAPYLGTYLTAKEIKVAGGLAAWPAPLVVPGGEVDTVLWRWLQGQTAVPPAGRQVPLFLGYGLDDRFAYNDAVLSAALPPSKVFTAPGGHDWPPWTVLWERIVNALPLPVNASCRAE